MTTISANRPLPIAAANTAPASQAAKPSANTSVVQDTAAPQPLAVNTDGPLGLGAYMAPGTATSVIVNGMQRLGTMPVIGNIIGASIKDGMSLSNLAWQVVPETYRNVKAVAAHKESAGRGAANVTTSAVVGIGKGIVAGAFVQILSVAAGPALGFLPVAWLPFAGIAMGLGGMMVAYKGLDLLVKKTGLDQKMANALTKIFGGDLKKS